MLKSKTALLICISILLAGGVFFWKTNRSLGVTYNAEYQQGIRNALAEINIPSSGNAAAIEASSENLANFIYYRSGVQISQENKNLLKQAEQQSWTNSSKIAQNQLAQILTDVSFEKLPTLSDSDIDNMAETLRGFNDPSFSPAYQNMRQHVKLRANGEGSMEPAYFVNQIKTLRNAARGDRGSYVPLLISSSQTALYNSLLNKISDRSAQISAAQTNFFANSEIRMTPMQALLITYSVVADDLLNGNQVQLQQNLTEVQRDISTFAGEPYPMPQGHRAYGTNGYIYSSPMNLLLDESDMNRILTLIKERSN